MRTTAEKESVHLHPPCMQRWGQINVKGSSKTAIVAVNLLLMSVLPVKGKAVIAKAGNIILAADASMELVIRSWKESVKI